jgi:PPP family 3-phenylpropionic acid transporter
MNRNGRATLFGMALYLLVGANLPFLPVWMETKRGLSGGEISAIIAIATLVRIFAGPMIAAEAERRGLRSVLGMLALVTLLAYLALFPGGPILMSALLLVCTYVSWGVLSPLTEGLLIASTQEGRPDYGVARALASVCFIVSSLVVGALVQSFGAEWALWAMIVTSFGLCFASVLLPRDAPAPANRAGFRQTLKEGFGLYRNRRLLLLALSVSFIQSAHAYYYNLGSNVWLGQGIDASHLGALWSVGVGMEVLLLLFSGWLFVQSRWTPGALIFLGGAGAVLRWTLTGFAPALPVLYGLQSLHALSFAATHIGGLRFLNEEVAAEKVPVAMAINSAMAFGPMLAVFGVMAGWYYDMSAGQGVGAQARGYWLMAVIAVLGCACALPLLRRVNPRAQVLAG